MEINKVAMWMTIGGLALSAILFVATLLCFVWLDGATRDHWFKILLTAGAIAGVVGILGPMVAIIDAEGGFHD